MPAMSLLLSWPGASAAHSIEIAAPNPSLAESSQLAAQRRVLGLELRRASVRRRGLLRHLALQLLCAESHIIIGSCVATRHCQPR